MFKQIVKFLILFCLSVVLLNITAIQLNLKWFKNDPDYEDEIDEKVYIQVINPHKFKYLMNPETSVCGPDRGKGILLIAFVCVSPGKFTERERVRRTWSNRTLFGKN